MSTIPAPFLNTASYPVMSFICEDENWAEYASTSIGIARGLSLSFPADVASTAGKSGKMQGDGTLTIPAPNAVRGEIDP